MALKENSEKTLNDLGAHKLFMHLLLLLFYFYTNMVQQTENEYTK